MRLNPVRDRLSQKGQAAFPRNSAFRAEAETALASFRSIRDDLQRQVRRGDLTVKVARERLTTAAEELRSQLERKAGAFASSPRPFLDRIVEVGEARKRSREGQSIESLQRETNRLLRQTVIEQQLINRAYEFESRSFTRPMTGGPPAPTLDSLLSFHESARLEGDDAAMEWARRQLESLRSRVTSEEDHRKIDLACDRPDRINVRIIDRYVDAMRGRGHEELEVFVAQSLEARDANACAAAFLLAKEAPEGLAARWVRDLLDGLNDFPDAALEAVRGWEVDARRADADAAKSIAEFAIAQAEADVRSPRLEALNASEVERNARFQARPVAQPDEPIGLTLHRRGRQPQEMEEFQAATTNETKTDPQAWKESAKP